jgi:hypothetical protein
MMCVAPFKQVKSITIVGMAQFLLVVHIVPIGTHEFDHLFT